MRYIASYLLAILGGNAQPSSTDLKNILNSVDAPVDDALLDKFMEQVEGKDIADLIQIGKKSLASVSSVSVSAAPATASEAPAADAQEASKAAESEDDEAGDFALDLFGGDDY